MDRTWNHQFGNCTLNHRTVRVPIFRVFFIQPRHSRHLNLCMFQDCNPTDRLKTLLTGSLLKLVQEPWKRPAHSLRCSARDGKIVGSILGLKGVLWLWAKIFLSHRSNLPNCLPVVISQSFPFSTSAVTSSIFDWINAEGPWLVSRNWMSWNETMRMEIEPAPQTSIFSYPKITVRYSHLIKLHNLHEPTSEPI